MTACHRITASLCVFGLLATEPEATAQQADRFAVTQSFDIGSPELATYTHSDMVVVNSTRPASVAAARQWSSADLGLAATANIDGFSDGTDVLAVSSLHSLLPLTCRRAYLEFTVDAATVGLPFSVIASQAAGNGAASDSFGVTAVSQYYNEVSFIRTR